MFLSLAIVRGFFVSGTGEIISMARSEVITLSPAGAEIPDLRCEAPSSALQVKNPSIFVPVTSELFKQQRYDDAIRAACDTLTVQGTPNYIHWEWDENNAHRVTLVELIGQPGLFLPVINHHNNSIELRERDLCETL